MDWFVTTLRVDEVGDTHMFTWTHFISSQCMIIS
jgi:hypothetical protein